MTCAHPLARCLSPRWSKWQDCIEEPFAWADALGMLTASERYTAALEAFMAPCRG